MRTFTRSILVASMLVLLASACSTRPRKSLKYRKKGCNCPSWGMEQAEPAEHACAQWRPDCRS